MLLAYDLAPGVSPAEHDRWLKKTHLPDIRRVPGLAEVSLNRTRRVVLGPGAPGYVSELIYPDLETYLAARDWIKHHPFSDDSQPQGLLDIKFMILCEAETL